jgi:uncharacterized phage-associated protein
MAARGTRVQGQLQLLRIATPGPGGASIQRPDHKAGRGASPTGPSGREAVLAESPRYRRGMTTTARNVAAALCERLPGVTAAKLHKYLYYAQGHHLAMLGRPLFEEAIAAWDHGPVVPAFWGCERQPTTDADDLTNAELSTLEYVAARYGGLTINDLERLTKAETPWQLADAARRPGVSVTIRPDWLRDYFSTDGSPTAGEGKTPVDASVLAAAVTEATLIYEERYREGRPEQVSEAAV